MSNDKFKLRQQGNIKVEIKIIIKQNKIKIEFTPDKLKYKMRGNREKQKLKS